MNESYLVHFRSVAEICLHFPDAPALQEHLNGSIFHLPLEESDSSHPDISWGLPVSSALVCRQSAMILMAEYTLSALDFSSQIPHKIKCLLFKTCSPSTKHRLLGVASKYPKTVVRLRYIPCSSMMHC